MQKSVLGLLVLLVFLFAAGVAIATPDITVPVAPSKGHAVVTIPSHAVELAPGVFSLGISTVNGETVEGIAFVDYKEEFSHSPGHTATSGGATCYAFLAKGTKWKTTEQYILDTTNADGMSAAFVANAMEAGLNAWDDQVAFDVFGTRNLSGIVDGFDTASPDGKNEIMFGSISSPGAVAVTIVWGIFSGPIFGRKIVEFDQVYDDLDYNWGDATVNASLMDLQNVAAHEIGHAGGMGHPGDGCTEETMFRFVSTGETKKRSLNSGDIAGIQKLYS